MGTPLIDGLFRTGLSLATLLNRLPHGIAILDTSRRVRFMNRALEALTGSYLEEVRGAPCSSVLRLNLCHQGCPLDRADSDAGTLADAGNIVNRARQKIDVRVTTAPLTDPSGDLVGFVQTVEDATSLESVNHELQSEFGFGTLLGRSRRMREIFDLIPIIAQTDSSVLITGETGTGKDLLAEVIHEASDRGKGLFVKVNCGALPESLLESELFGHRKGAFTGAVTDKPGRIRLAHNGTVYLTEIGDLPLGLQVKLLTFLDDKVVYPLGDTKGLHVDVRIIAATHRDLEQMVKEGTFRNDLLYRLNVVRMSLPPLRERERDAELLIDHFLRLFATRFDKKLRGFSPAARNLLLAYSYPGNVRELRNIVEYTVNLSRDEEVGLEQLPDYVRVPEARRRNEAREPGETAAPASPVPGGEELKWSELERRLILDALVRSKGRRGEAAQLLGWGRSTLWRKMRQHGIA